MQFYSNAKLAESSQLEQAANCYSSLAFRPRADHQNNKEGKKIEKNSIKGGGVSPTAVKPFFLF